MKPSECKTLPDYYEFGSFRLYTRDQLLFKDGEEVHLTPKVMEILLRLLKDHGHLVEKDDLIKEIWPDTIVEENNLTRNISMLRKTLNTECEDYYIETIPKRGYRFIAEVTEMEESEPAGSETVGAGPPGDQNEDDPGSVLNEVVRQTDPPGMMSAGEKINIDSFESGKEGQAGKPRFIKNINTILLLITALLAVSLVAVLYLSYWSKKQTESTVTFPRLQLTRLPAVVSPIEATISSDGGYIAIISNDESGLERIVLNQAGSNTILQIVPPTSRHIEGLSFSPGDDQIYFIQRGDDQTGTLYRTSTLGDGSPEKILSLGLSSHVALSPDGLEIAFVRSDEKTGSSSLIIADVDGKSERILFERNPPDFISKSGSPAWSVDGKTIACIIGTIQQETPLKVAFVGVTKKASPVTYGLPWLSVKQLAWLPGRRGLIFLADEYSGGWHNQFWFMSIPGGKVNRITNDLTHYSGFSLTADYDSLITIQSDNRSDIWVVPHESGGISHQITLYNDRREGFHGIDWTPDGRLVFSSIEQGHEHLWIMNADGTQRTQLTEGEKAGSGRHFPRVSPDGRYLVFVSEHQGMTRIWRMNIDGNDARPLTDGPHDLAPQVSFDGKWIVFSSFKSGRRTLWKVPMTGGEATLVTDHPAEAPALAPDSNLIACAWLESESNGIRKLAIIDLDGAMSPRFFGTSFPTNPPLVLWMPDGKSLSYNQIRDGIANLWRQSLKGGKPSRITDLSFDNIASFAWSRDGKRLAIVRAQEIRNLIIISGLN